MGKRRSQMRQNVEFQRLGSTPQQPGSGPASDRPAVTPPAGTPAIRLAPPSGAPRAAAPRAARSAMPGSGTVERARDQVRDQLEWLEDNPLVLTLGGIALGILGGLLLPVSDAETERLAAVGESIADQVQVHVTAIGEDVVEHGKAVLVETVQASVLGGKSPVDAVQQSVQEHLATVAQNAQERVEASLGLNQQDA